VVNSPGSFTSQDLVTYDEAHESLVDAAYVTFQFNGNDFDNYQEFIVGNGAQSNSKTRTKRSCDNNEQYYNKPLQQNTNYRLFLRAFVTEVLRTPLVIYYDIFAYPSYANVTLTIKAA